MSDPGLLAAQPPAGIRQGVMAPGKTNSQISVIIPALNEETGIARSIASAVQEPDVEVIVVDGGSRDDTVRVARRQGAATLEVPAGRGRQMNAGAEASSGEYLVFLHADTILPPNYASLVRRLLASPDVVAGAFRLAIEGRRRILRWIETGANWRSCWLQLPYGDQALFLRSRLLFEMGGYADLPIMEDYDLVRRLARRGRIRLAPEAVVTSARRWNRLGVFRTTLLNQVMVTGHLLGVSPRRMARLYRRTAAFRPLPE